MPARLKPHLQTLGDVPGRNNRKSGISSPSKFFKGKACFLRCFRVCCSRGITSTWETLPCNVRSSAVDLRRKRAAGLGFMDRVKCLCNLAQATGSCASCGFFLRLHMLPARSMPCIIEFSHLESWFGGLPLSPAQLLEGRKDQRDDTPANSLMNNKIPPESYGKSHESVSCSGINLTPRKRALGRSSSQVFRHIHWVLKLRSTLRLNSSNTAEVLYKGP